MSLIPVLLKWPLVLLPVHIVFLELIIDPACSVVFEAESEEANVMNRPPRSPTEPLFSRRTLTVSMLQGVSVLLIVLAVYGIALYRGQGESEARALTFYSIDHCQLGLDPDQSLVVTHYPEYHAVTEQGIVVGFGGGSGLSQPGPLCSLLTKPISLFRVTPS
jgi:magnesium-transporting ATPase (P-type)